jgi:SAM-dependent methyltransferase
MINTPVSVCCPDDLGKLDPVSQGVLCLRCGRLFSSEDEIPELLPFQAFQESSAESVQMNAYRAGFSTRPERAWRRPLAVFLNGLGNGYLYRWAARALGNLSGVQPLTVLDAACGEGILGRYLSPRHAYTGIDFSTRLLTRAKRYNPASYFRADLHHLPFPNNTFDAVVSLQALQYLHRPQDALAQIARVLKPGGALLLTVPNNESFKYRLQGIPSVQLQRFDRQSLPALLAGSFQDARARTRGIWVPLPKLPLHAPGAYPVRWGLSWTVIARPRK